MNDSAGVLHAPLVRAQALEDRLGRRRVQDVESQGGRRGKGGVKDTPPGRSLPETRKAGSEIRWLHSGL